MTASISSHNSKTAVASQQESSLNKVSSAKTKEVAPGSAPEILNKAPATKINSSPAAVVSLGNSKSTGLDLYQKSGTVEKSTKKSEPEKTGTQNSSVNTKTTESKTAPEKPVKENVVKDKATKDSAVKEGPVKNNAVKEKPATETKSNVKNETEVKATTVKKSAEPEADSDGFVAGKGDVVVDIKNSDSGYNNRIYWSSDNFKTKNYIGIDNQTGSVNIGKFKEGTKIEFGIDNGVGQFFKSGAASGNQDNIQHAQISKTAEGTQFGFEDLVGGGDKDFNDAIINVRNVVTSDKKAQVSTPEVSLPETKTKATKEKTNTNRSGLGDGTNPGRGAGTSNATNQGTNNPGGISATSKLSKASAYTTKMVVESQLKVAV